MDIAEDRLNGVLAERVTENALMRRYELSRIQVGRLFLRISSEGSIAPLPGYGREFLPVLTSVKSYRHSYHFRLVVDPAAILEDTFVLDRQPITQHAREQQELLDGKICSNCGSGLFDLNTRFHETAAQCSNNEFFIECFARINRPHRLIDYRQALVPDARYAISRWRAGWSGAPGPSIRQKGRCCWAPGTETMDTAAGRDTGPENESADNGLPVVAVRRGFRG